MAATLADLRKQVKALYGLAFQVAEDPKFTDDILDLAINDAHWIISERTRCYRQRQVVDLPAVQYGVSSVPLQNTVIRIDDYSVQALLNGTWTSIPVADERDVRAEYGALELAPSGTPSVAFLRNGAALHAQVTLDFFPGVATTISSGVILQAYIWPGLLTGDADDTAFQLGLDRHLRTVAVWQLAKLDQASGRTDAPVATWAREAELALREAERLVELQTSGNIRRVKNDPRDDW